MKNEPEMLPELDLCVRATESIAKNILAEAEKNGFDLNKVFHLLGGTIGQLARASGRRRNIEDLQDSFLEGLTSYIAFAKDMDEMSIATDDKTFIRFVVDRKHTLN